jgi:hypothetical protein
MMEKAERFGDMESAIDRFMINLFKKRVREDRLDPNNLKGTWSEVRAILQAQFGRVTRGAEQNQHRLVTLYRIAVDEVKTNQS